MINFLYFLILVLSLNNLTFAMEKKPYHHLSDGTFRNPEGSPKRDPNVKWSYKIFNEERKKIADDMRDASKSASKNKSSEITDVNLNDVDSFLQKERPNLFIHGHTHRPDLHDLEYGDYSTQRIVLGDWDTFGWCLKLDANGPDLFKFKIE